MEAKAVYDLSHRRQLLDRLHVTISCILTPAFVA
jgi:hypothetical protein